MVYLTREEVERLNRGEVPAAQYMKGTLEWNEDYNYYWVNATGSWVAKEKKVSPQDPAICNYSGLPTVEHYSSREITIEDIHTIHKEMSDKELKEGVYNTIIDELDNREGETDEEKAYRKGYMDGYDEGLYDGENK